MMIAGLLNSWVMKRPPSCAAWKGRKEGLLIPSGGTQTPSLGIWSSWGAVLDRAVGCLTSPTWASSGAGRSWKQYIRPELQTQSCCRWERARSRRWPWQPLGEEMGDYSFRFGRVLGSTRMGVGLNKQRRDFGESCLGNKTPCSDDAVICQRKRGRKYRNCLKKYWNELNYLFKKRKENYWIEDAWGAPILLRYLPLSSFLMDYNYFGTITCREKYIYIYTYIGMKRSYNVTGTPTGSWATNHSECTAGVKFESF